MRHTIISVIACLICFSGCGQNKQELSSTDSGKDFPYGLEKIYAIAKNAENLRSLVVSYQNEVILEEYFDRYDSDSLDHVRSVTKSIMSTLIGIASDRGLISLDDSLSKYFGKLAKGKEAITVKHLLTMQSGIKWGEMRDVQEFNKWVMSSNETEYVLKKPMSDKPGTVWSYNSAGIHLLSVILTKASGMSTSDFAKKYLFEPLGIDKYRWEKLSDGHYNGSAGLELNPSDMVKIGQLYANNGMSNGQRILSEEFIKDATTPHDPPGSSADPNEGYGYCWFTVNYKGIKGFMASGFAGQVIAVAPEIDLVVAVTHDWLRKGKDVNAQQRMANFTLSAGIFDCILETNQGNSSGKD